MKCKHAKALIAEHLARDKQELPGELGAHLAECPRCEGLWVEQVRIHEALTGVGSAPAPAAPADLARRAHLRLREGERVPPAPLRVLLVYGSLTAVVLVGAIAFLATLSVSHQGDGPATPRIAEQSLPPQELQTPGGSSGLLPVPPTPADGARPDKQPVPPSKKASPPGGTGGSPPVLTKSSAQAPTAEPPAAPDTDEIDLLIICWAPGIVMAEGGRDATTGETETAEDGAGESDERLPHTAALAPQSGDMVAQATRVASIVRGADSSTGPSVTPVQSLMFAALPVRSMDRVAELTSVQAEIEPDEAESRPDPGAAELTSPPLSATLVDNDPFGGDEDESYTALCHGDDDNPVLLCGEPGLGGGDAV